MNESNKKIIKEMNESNKKIIKVTICLILMAVILAICAAIIGNHKIEIKKEFCITEEPQYLLLCIVENETISAVTNQENLQKALDMNNCSIMQEHYQIDIIYCNQETNLTKYKISANLFR